MGTIKSALEIALEKTENIKVDRESIRTKELKEEGMRIASSILKGEKQAEELKAFLNNSAEKDREIIRQGILMVALLNITLPDGEIDQDRIKKSGMILEQLGKKDADTIIDQLLQFFAQYQQNRKQLRDNLAARYQDVLKAKETEIEQKTGNKIKLQPEQDPEFMRILQENYRQLKDKYEEALAQAKKELEST